MLYISSFNLFFVPKHHIEHKIYFPSLCDCIFLTQIFIISIFLILCFETTNFRFLISHDKIDQSGSLAKYWLRGFNKLFTLHKSTWKKSEKYRSIMAVTSAFAWYSAIMNGYRLGVNRKFARFQTTADAFLQNFQSKCQDACRMTSW